MNWFSHDRFGMFIHWGLYSVTGGRWNNMETPWVSEWMMRKFKIPVTEYEKLADKFQPEKFDAERWVKTALRAGMKYMVITSKHHDGFAMFHSSYDTYNIYDATPFKRDPLAELAAAAEKYGLTLGFYYSHEQDWHESGAVGNTWDFPVPDDEAFEQYLNGKVRHQVRELLTRYGRVGVMWFDTPHRISAAQSVALREFVRKLAPECLVNSRIGNSGCWDFETLEDNHLPPYSCKQMAECTGTMNESWGYKPYDHGYRSSGELLENLSVAAARNANFMLNVGPDASGMFPPEAVERLNDIGAFLERNGEALYGSSALPLAYPKNRWGQVTCREDTIYFWCFRHPGTLRFYGIRNHVLSAEILGGVSVPFEQTSNEHYDYHRLILDVPAEAQTPLVIRVRCSGKIDCNKLAYVAG